MDLLTCFTKEKWRKIIRGSVRSTFKLLPSKLDTEKIAAGWPIELNDMVSYISVRTIANLTFQVFEVETYLKALQCDVQQRRSISGLHLATNVLWPEVQLNVQQQQLQLAMHFFLQAMVHIISKRFNLSMEAAKDIYVNQDTIKLSALTANNQLTL